MKTLFQAIYNHFIEDPLAASITGLYNTSAPDKAVFPYIVFSLVTNIPDIDSSQQWENGLLQFNIFSSKKSPKEITDIYELLKGDTITGEGFDYFDLLIDDYDTVILERDSAILTQLDNKIWQYNVTYSFMLTYTGESATEKFCSNFYSLLSI
ncbi:hypothetical protein LCGC14_2195800 [marine sediment metagenome]|uniref:Uncharacterized protein n=1 Tax=marine sediment metagenome TaxID=412755 RepID=A0A0F9GE06_9ZZZZ